MSKEVPLTRNRGDLGRRDLINKIAKRCNLTKKKSEEIVVGFFEEIASALRQGKTYEILGYGRFCISQRRARKGRNPKTGEELNLPSSKTVHFKVGRKLKSAVKD